MVKIRKIFILVLGVFTFTNLLFFGQHCSNVRLEDNKQFGFSKASDNPYLLAPPSLFPSIRRFVIFMDMSHSMVSGLCVQDVDSSMYDPNKTFDIFDPNKGVGSMSEHRPSGVDCKVDPSRPFGSILDDKPIDLGKIPDVFLLTHPGIDYTQDRFTVLENWVQNLRNEFMKPDDVIHIMIVPFSGGQSQKLLDNKIKTFLGDAGSQQFIDIKSNKIDQLIQWMKEEQEFNFALAKSDDPYRFEKRTMGTSGPSALYRNLYDVIQKDMRKLNEDGLLFYSTYQWIHVTDGILTPISDHIKNVLNSYQPCRSCAYNPKTCVGTCGALYMKMINAWGDPIHQDLKQMDFYFGLIQSLPSYFGSGIMRTDFIQVQPTRLKESRPSEVPFWENLVDDFKIRGEKVSAWILEKNKSNLKLTDSNNGRLNFRATHFYIVNPNARVTSNNKIEVDSDSDGLIDKDEVQYSTQLDNPRSNGYCLDIFMASPAFAGRCKAFVESRSCSPELDSDGDSLNECEENLLGTSAFDFDTDGDSIPDYFELIYGYNPLMPDSEVDSAGDGILNSSKFSAGLGPNDIFKKVPANLLTRFAVNEMGRERVMDSFGKEVWLDLTQLILTNLPTALGTPSISNQQALSISRVSNTELSKSGNLISTSEQLISPIQRQNHNTIVALARIVDVDYPDRIYWQIYKVSVPAPIELVQPQLSLSDFKLFRTRDQGGFGGQ